MQTSWLGNLFFLSCSLLTLSCLHFCPRDSQTRIRSFITGLVLSGYAIKRYYRSSLWTSGQLGPGPRCGAVSPFSCLPQQWLWKQSLQPFSTFFMGEEAPSFSSEPETISSLLGRTFDPCSQQDKIPRWGAQQASALVFWASEVYIGSEHDHCFLFVS